MLQVVPHRKAFTKNNSNRSFLLYIDESEEQDKKIIGYERLISAGKVNQEEEHKAKELLKKCTTIIKTDKSD